MGSFLGPEVVGFCWGWAGKLGSFGILLFCGCGWARGVALEAPEVGVARGSLKRDAV